GLVQLLFLEPSLVIGHAGRVGGAAPLDGGVPVDFAEAKSGFRRTGAVRVLLQGGEEPLFSGGVVARLVVGLAVLALVGDVGQGVVGLGERRRVRLGGGLKRGLVLRER